MIKYWPNQQSIQLNYAVVDLFISTKKKFRYNLSNNTNKDLYIDILNNIQKYQLFNITLDELEKLILDIIELNLNKQKLKKLNYKILYNFINQVSHNFLLTLNKNHSYFSFYSNKNNINLDHYNFFLQEHQLLLNNLLIYLIFGSSYIDNKLFIFNKLYSPYKHVQILFENFIIQTSNLVIYCLFNQSLYLSEAANFIQDHQLSNESYLSTRSIILFLNNLNLQTLIYKYINQPKAVYSARYQVWLIGKEGIITKYIYTYRLQDIKNLSGIKTLFLFCIEIKDIIIPKIEKITIIIGKYFLYLLINLLGNIIILIIRAMISYLQR